MLATRRLKVLKFYLQHRAPHVRPAEVADFFFRPPCEMLARKFIRQIIPDGSFRIILFKNHNWPFYFPASVPLHHLYQVVAETFCPADWHYFEVDETRVEPGDTVLDLGAAEGLFSFSVAARAGHIYAIEPLPMFAESMKRTFVGTSNLTVIPNAIGAANQRIRFCSSGIMSRISDSGELEVDMSTIDNLFHDRDIRVDYIKADLEGFELEMLSGARATIARDLPKIAITTYHAADHAPKIRSFLEAISPAYKFRLKGLEHVFGTPIMLHAWAARCAAK